MTIAIDLKAVVDDSMIDDTVATHRFVASMTSKQYLRDHVAKERLACIIIIADIHFVFASDRSYLQDPRMEHSYSQE